MTVLTSNISIRAFGLSLPETIKHNIDNDVFASKLEAEKFISVTGVKERRVTTENQCSSDLCFEAAQKIFKHLDIKPSEIGILINVTQTPDFHGPMNASILQNRLGLPLNCISFDIPSGCSGFIFGLYTILGLMKSYKISKGLFLIGDTLSKQASQNDVSAQPLFGDGATAVLLENFNSKNEFFFELGGDGSGFETIYLPGGGYRNPITIESLKIKTDPLDGIQRNELNCIMRGMDVFSFGITVVPNLILNSLQESNLSIDDIDYFVLHQANKFMLEKIRNKCKIPTEKFLTSLEIYGNTSGASIPITIVNSFKKGTQKDLKILVCGFGVGLSWGVAIFKLDKNCLFLN